MNFISALSVLGQICGILLAESLAEIQINAIRRMSFQCSCYVGECEYNRYYSREIRFCICSHVEFVTWFDGTFPVNYVIVNLLFAREKVELRASAYRFPIDIRYDTIVRRIREDEVAAEMKTADGTLVKIFSGEILSRVSEIRNLRTR